MDTLDSLTTPPPSTQPLTTPITPPPPPPAIGARLFSRQPTGYGDVWAPGNAEQARAMLVEVMPAVVLGDFGPVSAELVELLGDLQRITVESGNALEASAPAGWVYVGSAWGSKACVQMFGRGAGVRPGALMLAEIMAAGNHPPAPGEQCPVPPIVEVEVELPWLDAEEGIPGALPPLPGFDSPPTEIAPGVRMLDWAMEHAASPVPGVDDLPSMLAPAQDSNGDLPTVELPWLDAEEGIPGAAPSRAAVLIAQAFAVIKHARVTVDPDDGYTVVTGKRDLINPADKHSSDWLTDLLTHLEPTPADEKVILELVDSQFAHWQRPVTDSAIGVGDIDGILEIGKVKLYIGPEFTAFGDALFGLANLWPTNDDCGPVEAHADDAGISLDYDPVEVCCELLAEVLDEAHYAVGSVQVSEQDDESVVVIGHATFRIRALHFTGGSARIARTLGALGEALESRFLARHGETASEE